MGRGLMPIRDVTTTWAETPNVGGLYVVRSTRAGSDDKVRIGAGGNHGGKEGLRGRLERHASPPPKTATFATHDHQPYSLVLRAWALEGWSAAEIEDGEHIVYRPFLVRFPRLVADRADRSIFLIPPDADLSAVFAEIDADLHTMERLRA
jgi:hypothetical protein